MMADARLPMKMTRHASNRWRERCADLNLADEWANARRASKGQRRKLRAQLKSFSECEPGGYSGKVLVGPSKVVLVVIAYPTVQKVVTVFPLTGNGRWRQQNIVEQLLQHDQEAA
ncbi:hypothetical protein [Pseudomarimonas arenosa]|uniref:Uncharacterized protein n=1 Tax=Pseudomarimonas arenosa TaxID=2774145 RepID=A0AAW3ZEL8_9GAMM|nr:hypothetical protein [Pseudomarimonas arenosa]MBD8524134.1 hypothetical protein [Pseudomarimonas arenosa]